MTPTQPPGLRADEREPFEAWLMERHHLNATWNVQRNCYDEFPAHLAFKAWQARAALTTQPATSEEREGLIARLREHEKLAREDAQMTQYEEAAKYCLSLADGLSEAADALAQPAAPVAVPEGLFIQPVSGDKLWLWQDGHKLLAYRHEYPCYSPGGDPCVLGEPVAEAEYRESYDRSCAP